MLSETEMHIPTLIARKREGEELSSREIALLVDAYTRGEVPDYQMSAFAMAVFFKGMTARETAALTQAMLESGDCFSHRDGHPAVVDKHSTGGIGDKTSLVLAPLVACTGCWVPMVSGRGLGITGGTLDKLEAIPGFNVHIQLDKAALQLDRMGVVMMGQTDRFCPADKKLYALRDVTGTVPSIPLITASVLSKKLAAGVRLPASFDWHRPHWDACYTQYWRSARGFDPERYVAALAEAAAAGCDVVQYTPNQVKNAVAGYGGADKAQVQKMVQARLGLSTPPKPADAADSLAIAICHAWRSAAWRLASASRPKRKISKSIL
mgnify:CR=1 FL=1